MQLSHSRVELFKRNPLEYQLRYIDKLKTLPTDDPTHPLIIGNAMHKGMETTTSQGIHDYFMSYPIITDRHIEEAMKLEALIPKAKRMIPDGEHEVMLYNPDFIGFIDLVSKNEDGTYSIYDFKYSNNLIAFLLRRPKFSSCLIFLLCKAVNLSIVSAASFADS